MKKWLVTVWVFTLIFFTCCACTKESPEKPATGGGNESKFSAASVEESSKEESSRQESSGLESSETSSKPEESSSKPETQNTPTVFLMVTQEKIYISMIYK